MSVVPVNVHGSNILGGMLTPVLVGAVTRDAFLHICVVSAIVAQSVSQSIGSG